MAVFLITVVASSLPLQLTNPAWGSGLSRLIVDAASLPLVGLCLIRYSVHLQSLNPNVQEDRLRRVKLRISRVAGAGSIALALLAVWQVALFAQALPGLERQFSAARGEVTQRSDAVLQALSGALPEQIQQGWEQLQRVSPQASPLMAPSIEEQREELRSRAQAESKEAFTTLKQQAGAARFQLGRDLLRVLLVALIYAWAFRAFVRNR
ncbi:MAG: hypothetical protein EA413_01385 [Cyanobium sp. PLM2.Bin73]|nr:MAG: hypothetical protein EA413_01385 [Cyanobium sp. PLM2.Bin73]